MSHYPPARAPELLHIQLRRRREELFLLQAEIAETLRVTPECIGQWESGRRRMELGKLPRIAAILQMDAKELCAQALAEFYPLVHDALFRGAPPFAFRRLAKSLEVVCGRPGKLVKLAQPAPPPSVGL